MLVKVYLVIPKCLPRVMYESARVSRISACRVATNVRPFLSRDLLLRTLEKCEKHFSRVLKNS